MVAHYQRSRYQERVSSRCSLEISRCSPARPLAWPGREPINLPGGQFARVRYASIADQIPHRSELTLCAKSCREQMQQHERAEPELLDYLVGAGEEGRRDFRPKRPRGPQIDGQVEGCGRLERQMGGRGAAQNPVDIPRERPIELTYIWAIGHQQSFVSEGRPS